MMARTSTLSIQNKLMLKCCGDYYFHSSSNWPVTLWCHFASGLFRYLLGSPSNITFLLRIQPHTHKYMITFSSPHFYLCYFDIIKNQTSTVWIGRRNDTQSNTQRGTLNAITMSHAHNDWCSMRQSVQCMYSNFSPFKKS
mgnify:FL=1